MGSMCCQVPYKIHADIDSDTNVFVQGGADYIGYMSTQNVELY
jgi:hypothetical protein